MSKDTDFCYSWEVYPTNIGKIIDTLTITGLDASETASQKLVYKTGELIRNKITDKIVKLKLMPYMNWKNVEEIIISPEKRQEMLNELRQT